MASDARSMPFIKNLASSDRKLRTQSLTTLRTFLHSSATSRALTPLEHRKLWKGLFYALWMCDRPIPQQNLCAELASLLDVFPTTTTTSSSSPSEEDQSHQVVSAWLDAFWAIMASQWETGIDVLRMNKFLLLVRRVVGASLKWASQGSDKSGTSRKTKVSSRKGTKETQSVLGPRRATILQTFRDGPLEQSGDSRKMPVGLRLHVLDVWADEAEKEGVISAADSEEEEDQVFLEKIRELVQGLAASSPSKAVQKRATESLEDDRLPWHRAGGDAEMGDGGSWDGFED